MKTMVVFLAVLSCVASLARAGPNAGGTLVIHDTGIPYTIDLPIPPVTTPPIDCSGVDNEAPADNLTVWKVYAAFPEGSSPRLKALAWGMNLTSYAYVFAAGLPHPGEDFEVTQGGWPYADGGSIGESFLHTQTDFIVECYWFGGYGDHGEAFATAPHAVGVSEFVDDAVPAHEDVIAGFSSIGFGIHGITICAWLSGACCFPDGSCQVMTEAACIAAGGVPNGVGTVCSPNPCPAFGACCDLGWGTCEITTEADCGAQGHSYVGDNVPCVPNPCPAPPTGACCRPDGSCTIDSEAHCAYTGGAYQGDDTACTPNPCPQPGTGACCRPNGSCWVITHFECSYYGFEYLGDGTSCQPNPCPLSGACCVSWGGCYFRTEEDCVDNGGFFQGPGTDCTPNPCPPGGACCLAGGTCMTYMEFVCISHGGLYQGDNTPCDPNPCPQPGGTGACCFADGTCQVLTQADCVQDQGLYQGDDVPCTPVLCPVPTPTERTSWGQIKARYR